MRSSNIIPKEIYGISSKGDTIYQYTLANKNGMEVSFINYGGTITIMKVADTQGNYENVVLNYAGLKDYEEQNSYYGAIIGRYGNRIANGKFSIHDDTYTLNTNLGNHHLHGGKIGFDRKIWDVKLVRDKEHPQAILSYTSPDGEEGYPGTLHAMVTYTLSGKNELHIEYEATTDKSTVFAPTLHAYFNLSGDFNHDILDHELLLNSEKILEVDAELIPSGDYLEVANSPFDFTSFKPIGQDINAPIPALQFGGGYDHCWVLDNNGQYEFIGELIHPPSGRKMTVFTDQPGVQLYTGNFINETSPLPYGGTYKRRSGLCLETQHFPNSPNQYNFPSTVLNPNEKYYSKTTYAFSTIDK